MAGGRPTIELDKKQFEALCGFQCTLAEIASHFDVTEKTVIAWCKRTYKDTFYSVFEQKRGKGKVSLRRRQYQKAMDGDTAMLIFLGKNWLGQADRPELLGADTEAEAKQGHETLMKAIRNLKDDNPAD